MTSSKDPNRDKSKTSNNHGSAVLADLNEQPSAEKPKDEKADARKKSVLSRLNDD